MTQQTVLNDPKLHISISLTTLLNDKKLYIAICHEVLLKDNGVSQ